VLSLNFRERERERDTRGYDRDNGAGLRRTKAARMPRPCSRGRTRNATLVRYGLSFVIPLSGDCDTEDTTATSGRGETAGDLIQFTYPRLYAARSSRCSPIRIENGSSLSSRLFAFSCLRFLHSVSLLSLFFQRPI